MSRAIQREFLKEYFHANDLRDWSAKSVVQALFLDCPLPPTNRTTVSDVLEILKNFAEEDSLPKDLRERAARLIIDPAYCRSLDKSLQRTLKKRDMTTYRIHSRGKFINNVSGSNEHVHIAHAHPQRTFDEEREENSLHEPLRMDALGTYQKIELEKEHEENALHETLRLNASGTFLKRKLGDEHEENALHGPLRLDASGTCRDEVEVPPPLPTTQMNTVFEKAISAMINFRKEHKATSTLFWSALDLRDHDPDYPLDDNERATEFVDYTTHQQLVSQFERIMNRASAKLSSSAVALLSVMRTLLECHELNRDVSVLARTIMVHGTAGLIDLLKRSLRNLTERILSEDDEDHTSQTSEDSAAEECNETREIWSKLENDARQMDKDDEMTIWICRKLVECADIANCPQNPTERTIDIYYVVPFAKLPNAGVRYGEGCSRADDEDKKRRQSTTSGGKKVDFDYFLGTDEIGVGENFGYKSSRDKRDGDFIAATKCAIAQIRSLVKKTCVHLEAQNIAPSKELKHGFAQIAVPFHVIRDYTVRFFCMFVVCDELYAFAEWAAVDSAGMNGEILSILDMAENFLLFEALAGNAASLQADLQTAARRLVSTFGKKQRRASIWSRGGAHGVKPRPLVKNSTDRPKTWSRASAPLAGATPKKKVR
ncbi:uncharacterized protein SPPG_07619 [Spizellomyces punctatus DAOM BR117]|uniref:Uncharacterized protein n=1 Tax=Spizellomyces punctatus (strain DAOM BR117) TaxID=645134 RepID=A0A0L0H7N6_SPIPD|nr:uncharacterized protein SPPG_07619 [Spizellomyces punctatus DAOM BR117]KNC97232.1 hypothetical protein SPPG_07619 [Spizellomyces punctatus DAOM BR117]|eukprot:XP_016605272.1 hypothetical protein SPPG_07619 [Spizellomyces punctatus DAOM BR117]